MSFLKQDGDDLILQVRVQPKASRNVALGEQAGRLKVALTAPPVDGAANEALVNFLASTLEIPRRLISFERGERGREKTLRLRGQWSSVERILQHLSAPR